MELRRSHRIRVSDYTENRTGQSTGHEENDNDNDDDYNEERVVVQKYKSRKRPSAKLPEVESIDTLISAKRQRSQFVDKSDQLQLVIVVQFSIYVRIYQLTHENAVFTVICPTQRRTCNRR